jgi:hypothetical protein
MRMRTTIPALLLATSLAAAPAAAGGFSAYGTYWDTDAADSAAGGGLRLGVPLGPVLQFDLGASYYEELVNRPFRALGDVETPFVENGLQVWPVEAGLRLNFAEGRRVNPYLGGGAHYLFMDSDFGEVDDEAGWYARLGTEFGEVEGNGFFVEAGYRGVEVTVENDPADFEDFDDVDFEAETEIDLSGALVNLGYVWRF